MTNYSVLKCTHDSIGVSIRNDKSKFNIKRVKKKISKSLKTNLYNQSREWQNTKPRIMCEKFIIDEYGIELKDYKIFCFGGKHKIVQLDYNRFTYDKGNLYDT